MITMQTKKYIGYPKTLKTLKEFLKKYQQNYKLVKFTYLR